jgi:ABC-type dipeptide/oligopeptide/nickel transport system permease component
VQYLYIFPPNGLHDVSSAGMAFLPHFTAEGWRRGWLFDTSWHLILPIICYTYGGFAFLTKLTRGAVLDNLSSDYIRTARAKGISERRILFTHVFRNSLLPLITAFAGVLPALISGSIIIETIFSIPGMGKLSIDAIFARDRELILAGTLIAGVLGLLSRLVSDDCYTNADPRVSYE